MSFSTNTTGSSWKSLSCSSVAAGRDFRVQHTGNGSVLLDSTWWWELVVQNDRDWTCKVLTGDSARAFHTEIIRIIAQTAQLDTIHLIFKNTNSFSGLFPALGKMKWRQVAVLWLCSSPQPGSGHSHRRPALTLHRAEGMATPLLQ